MLTLSLFLLVFAQGLPGRPYAEERQLLNRHLAQLSRPLPNTPAPSEDAALLVQLAAEAGLRNVEVGAPTITETGSIGQTRRMLTANSTYPDADRFFRAVQGSARLIDVESLVLRSADFGVRIEARLRFYHRPPRVTPTASLDPARMRDRTRGATREEAALFARDEQLVLEKTILLDELRRRHTSPRMFLAETGASFRDAAAALTFGSLDGDTGRFTLRGVVAGLGAAESLARRLEDGFFHLREFSQAHKDGCYQFEVVGEAFRAGPQAALPLPVDEPFRPTEPLCQRDRDGVIAGVAGATLRISGSQPGGIALRAVDTDMADIAAMVEALTRAPIVVAGDVVGRVNVDFSGASLGDVLKALPAHSEQLGEVWLVRPMGSPSLRIQEANEGAESGRFSFREKRARGEDLLAAMAEAEPAYIALGPPGLARLSVFARDAATADVRRAALAALQLEESREEDSRVLRFHERASEIGPIAAVAGGPIVFRGGDLTVDEVLLAGIGRAGEELLAFVYSPLGDIVALRLGDALADGVVAALDLDGLLVDTSEGPVRISISVPSSRSR
jgi:hypothetical protein